MPILLLPLLLIAFLVFAPIASMPPAPSAIPAPEVVEFHYVRNGVVQLNRSTGGTRFILYRLAGDLDRCKGVRHG